MLPRTLRLPSTAVRPTWLRVFVAWPCAAVMLLNAPMLLCTIDAALAAGATANAAADPARSVEQSDLAARLRELLTELPHPQREAIDLWCEGFTHRDIAGITGRTEGHVRVLVHRGLTTLRTHPLVRPLLAADAAPPITNVRH